MSISTTALFCCLDDFARSFEEWEKARLLGTPRTRHRPGKLSLSEMLFIMVLFHLAEFKNFKCFWLYGMAEFHFNPRTPSSSYLGESKQLKRKLHLLSVVLPLTLLLIIILVLSLR